MFIDVGDTEADSILPHLDPVADIINEVVKGNGGSILVHCFAGMSRSGSCVVAYLMKHAGMP